jgi:hypothetical protein
LKLAVPFLREHQGTRAGQIQKNTLDEQRRELRARKLHEQDSDGIAQADWTEAFE